MHGLPDMYVLYVCCCHRLTVDSLPYTTELQVGKPAHRLDLNSRPSGERAPRHTELPHTG